MGTASRPPLAGFPFNPRTIRPMKNSLRTGEFLRTDEYLVASNRSCFLIMQGDGNLCLYQGDGPAHQGGAIWCALSTSRPQGAYFAAMQGDGNLAVYRGQPGGAVEFVWATGSVAPGGQFVATVEGSGLLVVGTDTAEAKALWASRQLRVLTYNTHLMEGSNIVVGATYARKLPVLFRDEERYHFIVEKIRQSGADIVALQEVWSEKNMERIMTDLRAVYPYCQRGSSGPLYKAGSGIVMASKFPFTAGDFYAFPGATDLEEAMATKGVLRATIELPDGGGRLSVGLSHCWTDAGGPDCDNIRDLIQHTVKGEDRAILMGDFNIHRRGNPTKFGRLTALMTGCGATDSWSQVHGPTWSDACATDDQIDNTLSQFFSPDRNTPDPDCIDYVYLRKGGTKTLRPIRAEVPRDWKYSTGDRPPAWYWVHEGTVAGRPAAATFGDQSSLCVVTRNAEGGPTLQSAVYDRASRRWRHHLVCDAQGKPVEAHGAPGLVWFEGRLQLFYPNDQQIHKMESSDGSHWTAPQRQGPALRSSGGICVVVHRNTLHAFVRAVTGGVVCHHKWVGHWEECPQLGLATADDVSAVAVGDLLCVVARDNVPSAPTGRVMRAIMSAQTTWDIGQVGNSSTSGGVGIAARGGRFELYYRAAAGEKIVRRASIDGKNWDDEKPLELGTTDVVCPVAFGDLTLLFFPFPHVASDRLIYKQRALAHGCYPPAVALDGSDHYPYVVDLVWPS